MLEHVTQNSQHNQLVLWVRLTAQLCVYKVQKLITLDKVLIAHWLEYHQAQYVKNRKQDRCKNKTSPAAIYHTTNNTFSFCSIGQLFCSYYTLGT